jgi:hypothetical protein
MMDRCHREAVILTSQSLRQKDAGKPMSRHEQLDQASSSSNTGQPSVLSAKNRQTTTTPIFSTPHLSEEVPRSTIGGPFLPNTGELHRTHNFLTSSGASGPAQDNAKSNPDSEITREGELATEAAMSLESLAWGAHREQTSKVVPSPVISTLVEELQGLIDTKTAREILTFHKEHVAWMHNVIYFPHFLTECEDFLNGGPQRDAAWLSLYFAVLCVRRLLTDL